MNKKSIALKRGFTLIELLLVIAILGVLSAAVVIAINPKKRLDQANDTKAKNDFGQVATALSAYFTSNSTYPVGATWATLDALETSEDLKAVPDGATGYTYSYSGNATNAALWVTLKSPKVSSLPVLCWRSATGGFTEVAAASCAP